MIQTVGILFSALLLTTLPQSSSASTFGHKSICCLATGRRGRRRPRASSSSSTGFGGTSPEAIAPTAEEAESPILETNKKTNGRIYSLPALYDLAFGYRNYEAEVDFLIGQHQMLHKGTPPCSVLELAAGPSRHSIQALGAFMTKSATVIDRSPEMVEYAKETASIELDEELQSAFTVLQDDMCTFQMEEGKTFDSAWILLGSLQHLTTNDKVISCFQAINRVLAPGGTLIVELPHPRETFSLVECTRNGWEVPLEDDDGKQFGELAVVWGDDNDEFDPIKQVRQFTVSMQLKGVPEEDAQNVKEVVPMRLFTTQEIDALSRLAGFEIAALHGALADDVDVNDEDEAFRLVCVLQKTSEVVA